MYMLDTNIIIFCIRHPDSVCCRRLAGHIGKDLCISAVTYAELECGIMNSGDPIRHRAGVIQFLEGISILDFDMAAAMHFGSILAELHQAGKDRVNRDRDKMIAAHARSRGDILVTNNLKDFKDIEGLMIEDWRVEGDLRQ